MPVPSVSSSASAAPLAAPARASASSAQLASLSTTTGRSSRSLIRSRNGTPSSGRWTHASDTARSRSISDGMPKPTASASGRRSRAPPRPPRRTGRARPAAPRRATADARGDARRAARPRRRRAASCHPRRSPPLALRPCSDAIHPGSPSGRPTSRSTRSTARGAGCSTGCRDRATRSRSCARPRGGGAARAPRRGPEPLERARPSAAAVAADPQVGRDRGRRVAPALVRAVHGQRADHRRRLRGDRGGALERRQPAHRQHGPRARLGRAAGGQPRARRGGLAGPRGQHPAAARRPRLGAAAVDPARLRRPTSPATASRRSTRHTRSAARR